MTRTTFATSAGLVGEYNLTPNFALRLAPEYFFTGYGSHRSSQPWVLGGHGVSVRKAVTGAVSCRLSVLNDR